MGWGGGDTMNVELLGMSNEDLIQWACKYGVINEKKLRWQMPSIEHFCAQNPISIDDFIQHLVALVNDGIKLGESVKTLMEYYKESSPHKRTSR